MLTSTSSRNKSFSAAIVLLASCALFHQTNGLQSSASGTSLTITSSNSFIRLRANKLRRPESCRENLPRKSEDLPVLVIVGRVKEVYMAGEQSSSSNNPATSLQSTSNNYLLDSNQNSSNNNKALINISRIIKGNQQLLGSDIIVSGFNGTGGACPNYVKPNDTYILLLNQEHVSSGNAGGAFNGGGGLNQDRFRYSIDGNNLLSMNLNNLDRINAIASDEPFKRRGPIEDILCEARYCPYGRCVIVNQQLGQTSCQCPDSCPPLPAQVCGSDNQTYTNECHLIREGCRLRRPLFVTKETSC